MPPGSTAARAGACPSSALPLVHGSTVDAGRLDPVAATEPPPDGAAGIDLAPDQRRAVLHDGGPVRVIAPAGSGKTRVLTERIRYLLGERGYDRDGLIAVAYNKEAQRELEARLFRLQPQTRTLNSLGYRILTAHRGGRPPLLDEPEVRTMIGEVFPIPRQRRANTDPVGPYLDALTLCRLGLREPSEVEEARDDVPGFADGFDDYRSRLAGRGAVDFDEQIYGSLEALLRDGGFRRRMQAEHRHLLVDEFQDLTPAHVLLIRLLAMPELDVFGVGDDDQTIYDHAGADPRFLVDYADYFPGAGATALEVNYRCAVPIVDARADAALLQQGPGREGDPRPRGRRRRRPRTCGSRPTRPPTPPGASSRSFAAGASTTPSTPSGSPSSPASTRCCWRRRSRSGRRACRCGPRSAPTCSSAPASPRRWPGSGSPSIPRT